MTNNLYKKLLNDYIGKSIDEKVRKKNRHIDAKYRKVQLNTKTVLGKKVQTPCKTR